MILMINVKGITGCIKNDTFKRILDRESTSNN